MTKAKRQTAAQTFGRLGGQAGTKAQDKARRINGQLGGRPSRVCWFCAEPVLGGHKDRRLDETCGAHGWQWKKVGADRSPEDLTTDWIAREIESHQQAIADLQKQLVRLRRMAGGS